MDKFLENKKLPKVTQEERDTVIGLYLLQKLHLICKTFPQENCKPDGFPGEFCKNLK